MDIYDIKEELRKGRTIYDINLRVAYYARVSTDKEDQLNSLENQKNYFLDKINNNKNWVYVNSYIDEGISGTSIKNRNSFLKMIEDAKNNKFDLLLTKEISRFSRNTVDSIKYTELLLKYNVIVYFLVDNLITINEDSELRLTLMASLAQDEVRKISERVKFGINRMINDRKVLGGSITGYYKHKGILTINEKEAKIIKYIFNSYLVGNISLKQIGINLSKLGYYNSKGCIYSQTTLAKIITNPRYKGYYTARITEVKDYKTHKKVINPYYKRIVVKDNNIPPIIDEVIWDRVNKLYNKRKRRYSSNINNSNNILSNSKYNSILYCSSCNNYYIRCSGGSRHNPTWVCNNYKKHGISSCISPIIKEEYLDTIIINIFKNINYNDVIDDYINIIKEDNINNYKKDKNIEYKKNKLLDLYLNNLINKDIYESKYKEYNNNIDNKKKYNINYLSDNINKYLSIRKQLTNIIKVFIYRIYISKINNNRNNLSIKIILNNKKIIYRTLLYNNRKNYYYIR